VHARPAEPSLLVTSACVHRGASGAAVVDAASGELLGLVTSNARHAGGVTLPHLNFAIAREALGPLLAACRQVATDTAVTQPHSLLLVRACGGIADVDAAVAMRLRALDTRDVCAERVWRLRSGDAADDAVFEAALSGGCARSRL
jgi:hypothetical protein